MFWWSQVTKRLQNLKNWFSERGYLGSLVDKWLEKVKAKSTEKLLRPKGIDNKSVGILFCGYLSPTP